MEVPPNMEDYELGYRSFTLFVPKKFSFPLDVFDQWGKRLALLWTDGDREQRYSFNDLKMPSAKGAGALKALGAGQGDRVLVMLPALPEWWETMLALKAVSGKIRRNELKKKEFIKK